MGQEGGPLRRADRWGPTEKGWPVSLLSKRETGPRGERRESKDQKIRDAGKWGNRDLETWETRTMDTERRPRERPSRHKEAEQRPGEVKTQEDKTPESNRDCEPGQGQKSGTVTETQSAKTDKANFTVCGLYLLKEKKRVQTALQNLGSLQRKDLPIIIPLPAQQGPRLLPWLPLTWVVVGCGLIDHDGVLDVGAEGRQNYSCGETQG